MLTEKNIAIEVDGGYHILTKEYDKQRDIFFKSIGIKTIRIKNDDVNIFYIKKKIYPQKKENISIKYHKDKNNFENQINQMIKRYNLKYDRNISQIEF